MSTATNKSLRDPRELYPRPPFTKQEKISPPGTTPEMSPRPIHGEDAYEGTGRLRGLNAVITGADSGIGRAIAICFAREGANVVINYLSEDDDANETQRHVAATGAKSLVVKGDLTDEAFCDQLIKQAVSELGSVDVLVNNAAIQRSDDSLDDVSTEMFDRVFKTNVYANFWLCRAALRSMPAGGSIITTVSIQGYEPSPNLLPYAATKSALLGMTKAMAKMAIEQGVRVNAVAPGPVWTPLIPATLPAEKVEHFGENTLFGRPAQPVELAPLYVWLASPEASYVTGEVFGATGGRTPV